MRVPRSNARSCSVWLILTFPRKLWLDKFVLWIIILTFSKPDVGKISAERVCMYMHFLIQTC